jgi:hypothetical protein
MESYQIIIPIFLAIVMIAATIQYQIAKKRLRKFRDASEKRLIIATEQYEKRISELEDEKA